VRLPFMGSCGLQRRGLHLRAPPPVFRSLHLRSHCRKTGRLPYSLLAQKAEVLVGDELKAVTKVLRTELQDEGVKDLPAMIWARTYFRTVLSYGATAGTRRLPSDSGSAGRRNFVLGVCSTDRRHGADGTEEEFETFAYGAALHYAVLRISGKTRAYAYMECVKSDADVSGRYGLTSQHRGMFSFRSFGGACRYVDVCALDYVVGTLQRGTRLYVPYPRIPFSLVES